jgi:hypothetical protein
MSFNLTPAVITSRLEDKILEGKVYTFTINTTNLGAGGVLNVYLKGAASGRRLRVYCDVTSSLAAQLTILEGATTTNSGLTAITPRNMKRDAGDTAPSAIAILRSGAATMTTTITWTPYSGTGIYTYGLYEPPAGPKATIFTITSRAASNICGMTFYVFEEP